MVPNRRSVMSKIAAGAGVLAFALMSASSASARSPELQKVIDAAKKEGVLKVLWTEGHMGGDVGLRAMVAAMNKRYGTNITLQFTQGGSFPAILGRLTQEHRAKQTSSSDVFLGTNHMYAGLKSGMLMKVDWNKLIERPQPKNAAFDRVNPQGVGVAVASRVAGIVYNTNLVKGDDIPTSMEDLLKPKWKGQILTTPYVTGFYQFAAPDMLGEKYIMDYVKRLKPQIGGFISCNSLDKLASGEFAMLIFDCGRDATVRYQKRGAPLGHAIPKEAIYQVIINLGVPVTAEHPNVGKLFTVFLHTEEGQKLLWKHGAYDLEIYPGSNSKKLIEQTKKRFPDTKLLVGTVQRTEEELAKGIDIGDYQDKIKKILRGRRR